MFGAKLQHFLPAILVVYWLTAVYFLFQKNILMWDSAVYLGMAKYLFSLGTSGFWEPLRPPLWPVFLGIFWKIGLSPLFWGKITNIVFITLTTIILYVIMKKWMQKPAALLVVVLLLFSQTLFFYTYHVFTEIPTMFFIVLAVYTFFQGKNLVAGIALGFAFLTKFPAGIYLPIFVLFSLNPTRFEYIKKNIPLTLLLLAGFFIPTLPFFISNYYFYSSFIYPLTESANSVNVFLECNSLAYHPWYYYFVLLVRDNPFTLFALIGIFAVIRKPSNKKVFILLCAILPLLYFTQLHCRYNRYAILFFPFIVLLSGIGFNHIFRTNTQNTLKKILLVLVLIISFFNTTLNYAQKELPRYTFVQQEYLTYLEGKNLTGDVWVSNPISALYVDYPVKLAYYKYFNASRACELQDIVKKPQTRLFLFDTCMGGLICPPNDSECEKETRNLLTSLDEYYNVVHLNKENNCTYSIFERKKQQLFNDTSKAFISLDFNDNANFTFVLEHAQMDVKNYIVQLKQLIAVNQSDGAETLLVLSRLTNNQTLTCLAAEKFAEKNYAFEEYRAILYETLASINCGEREKYFLQAAELWKTILPWRSELDAKLAYNQTIVLDFDETEISSLLPNHSGFHQVTLGAHTLVVTRNDTILTQTDRVRRDWLGLQIYDFNASRILSAMSERLTYPESELRSDIGWHEGGRLKEISHVTSFENAVGTLAARKNGMWYGADENGIFRFEIPEDKLFYPTTRYFTRDLAMIIDTHGVNMLVEQALRKHVSVVVSDCDHPGKAKAADYLSKKGLKIICIPDRFAYLLLGHNDTVVGSPPYVVTPEKVIFGNRPVTVTSADTIIVANSTRFYYDTAYKYFSELQKNIPLSIKYVSIDANGLSAVINVAREENAQLIAARVFNSTDYQVIKDWLDENKNNKVILFHSLPYPYGYLLLKEYPQQTSFDDPNPVFG